VYIADYLPMDAATRRSQLVISNGGSLTTYHALANGVPVIGLCSNMDQLLNMHAVERLDVGLALRAAKVSSASLSVAVSVMQDNPSYTRAASRVRRMLSQYDSGQCFREIVAEILSRPSIPRR
jgi:UDP:flavonoid glycosyltransferase YjiC (YdhE family)